MLFVPPFLIPPPSTLLPGFEARVQRLLEYLNGRRLKGSVPLQVSVTSSSSFLSPSGTGDKGRAGRRGGGREGGPGAAMVSAHMPFPPVGSQSTRHEWLVLSCDKVHTHSHSSTLATVHHAHSLPLFLPAGMKTTSPLPPSLPFSVPRRTTCLPPGAELARLLRKKCPGLSVRSAAEGCSSKGGEKDGGREGWRVEGASG